MRAQAKRAGKPVFTTKRPHSLVQKLRTSNICRGTSNVHFFDVISLQNQLEKCVFLVKLQQFGDKEHQKLITKTFSGKWGF